MTRHAVYRTYNRFLNSSSFLQIFLPIRRSSGNVLIDDGTQKIRRCRMKYFEKCEFLIPSQLIWKSISVGVCAFVFSPLIYYFKAIFHFRVSNYGGGISRNGKIGSNRFAHHYEKSHKSASAVFCFTLRFRFPPLIHFHAKGDLWLMIQHDLLLLPCIIRDKMSVGFAWLLVIYYGR